ncbi:MAG: hypothetical protein V2J24_09375 [Pseudomonadales bacterium]|jgi:hypothetical protein|nr:hypothetical protein [Pseudomonadales bacterium]
MADDRTKHPAPLPADADDLELEFARTWRVEAADDADGPSELADARILRAAREAAAGGRAEAPRRADPNAPAEGQRWRQWSAAAGLLCTVGIGLLLWRAAPTGTEPLMEAAPARAAPAPAEATAVARREAQAPQRRIAEENADAAREAPTPEGRIAEEVAVRALRQARPVTESPAPAPPPVEPASGARKSAAPADDAAPIAELAARKVAGVAGEVPALTGRLQQDGARWFLEPDAAFADRLAALTGSAADRAESTSGAAATTGAERADSASGAAAGEAAGAAQGEATAPRLALDLDALSPAARVALRDGARVRIRYRVEGSVARVMGIEPLPE